MRMVRGLSRPASMPRGRLGPALLALALVSSSARPSAAQDRTSSSSDASSSDNGANTVKGMIGGGMLGAEIVMLTESALRLRPGWMYLVGGAAGAAGGAYLGYELCDDSSNRPPAFLLAGGIALIIPTVMGVLTATQYEPSGPLDRDKDDEAAKEKAAVQAADEKPDARLDPPSMGLAQTFSREDLARFRVRQVTEVHLTFLRGVF